MVNFGKFKIFALNIGQQQSKKKIDGKSIKCDHDHNLIEKYFRPKSITITVILPRSLNPLPL